MFLSGLFAHLHWETPLSPPSPIPDPVPEKICRWQLHPAEIFKIMPTGYLICPPDLPRGSTSWVSPGITKECFALTKPGLISFT